MFGGTPSNPAISIMNGGNIEVMAGINLPMLIKLATVRDCETLAQAVCRRRTPAANMDVASRILNPKCATVKPQATEPAK